MYLADYTFVDQTTILKQNSEPKEDFRCVVEVLKRVGTIHVFCSSRMFNKGRTTYTTADVFDSKI
jgi:hypothetical protein